MRVVKVMNNSLVLALDDSGQEVILMGKGIGFGESTGNALQQEKVEKVFVMKDRKLSRDIIQLAADTDEVFFELAKVIIDYAKQQYQMELMPHLYLSLTDHLAYAVRRTREGIIFRNFYTLEMKRFNPKEYKMGCYAIELVKEKLGIELPEDEAGSIAFHFMNARQDNPYAGQNKVIDNVVGDILNIIQYSFQIVYDKESISYTRCVTHLRLFAQRLICHEMLAEEQNLNLYKQVLESCGRERGCVKKINIYVMDRFGVKITSQEELYLTLHIHRVLDSIQQKK